MTRRGVFLVLLGILALEIGVAVAIHNLGEVKGGAPRLSVPADPDDLGPVHVEPVVVEVGDAVS